MKTHHSCTLSNLNEASQVCIALTQQSSTYEICIFFYFRRVEEGLYAPAPPPPKQRIVRQGVSDATRKFVKIAIMVHTYSSPTL